MAHDFFVSYSHEDSRLTEQLERKLAGRGLTVWWDRCLQSHVGEWRKEIADRICDSGAIIVLLTSRSLTSSEVAREVQFADQEKKGVIPLVAGELPSRPEHRGLLLRFSADQRISTRAVDSIDDECIDSIAALAGLTRFATISNALPLDLQPLDLEVVEIPAPIETAGPVYEMISRHLKALAQERRWDEAGRTIEQMTSLWNVNLSSPSTINTWQSWLEWMTWYEDAARRFRTWSEVVSSIRQAAGLQPGQLRHVCPSVGKRLEEEWWRQVDKSLERFLNCVRHFGPKEGSYLYALDTLEILTPQALEPLRALMPGLEEGGVGADLYESARGTLIYHSGAGRDAQRKAVLVLRGLRFPCAGESLERLRGTWPENQSEKALARRFLEGVSRIAEHRGGEASAAGQLRAHLMAADAATRNREQAPEFETVAGLRACWQEGIERLAGEKIEPALDALDRAATFFRGAKEHAVLVRSWDKQRGALNRKRAELESGESSPETFREWSDFEVATRSLENGLVEPEKKEGWPPDGGAMHAAGVVRERLTRSAEAARMERWLLESVGLLAANDPERAQAALEELARDHEGEAEARPWIRVCAAARMLAPVGEAELERFLEMPDQAFGAWEAAVEDAVKKVDEARLRHPLLKGLRVVGIERARTARQAARACRQLWSQARERMESADFEGARQPLSDLSGRVPSAAPLLDAVARLQGDQIELQALRDAIEAIGRGTCTADAERSIPVHWRPGATEGASAWEGSVPAFARPVVPGLLERSRSDLERKSAQCMVVVEAAHALERMFEMLRAGRYPEVKEPSVPTWLETGPKTLEGLTIPVRLRVNLSLSAETAASLDGLTVLVEGGEGRTLEVDAATGLPPPVAAIEGESARVDKIATLAQEALERLDRLEATPRLAVPEEFARNCQAEARRTQALLAVLHRYAACIQDVLKKVEQDDWDGAKALADKFDPGVPALEPALLVVTGALATGVDARPYFRGPASRQTLSILSRRDLSHPLLAPLRKALENLEQQVVEPEQVSLRRMLQAGRRLRARLVPGGPRSLGWWLTTPVVADAAGLPELWEALERAQDAHDRAERETREHGRTTRRGSPVKAAERVRRAAGANLPALLTAMGEVGEVVPAVRCQPVGLLANLGAAAFAHLEEHRDATSPANLRIAVGVGALFACFRGYREALAQGLGADLPPDLAQDTRAIRNRVRDEIERAFANAGVAWGTVRDGDSWAVRWEAECYAVSNVKSGYAPLPWPLGPALAGRCPVDDAVASLLQVRPELRPWFGPCGLAEAMVYEGHPQAALDYLDRAALDDGAARGSPGYSYLSDPAAVLRRDADSTRGEALVRLLNHDQYTADASADGGDGLARRMVQRCGLLLDLEQRGVDARRPFVTALQHHFENMVKQLASYARRPDAETAVHEGDARKRCMDGVIQLLAERFRQRADRGGGRGGGTGWLSTCVRDLKARRTELSADLINQRFEVWRRARTPRLLEEMVSLAEQAERDAPADPVANFLRASTLLLRAGALSESGREAEASDSRQRAKDHLDRAVNVRARHHGWPLDAITKMRELRDLTDGPSDLARHVLESWQQRNAEQGEENGR